MERPDKYDNLAAKFNTWFDNFKDLPTSRNGNGEKVLGMIENRGKVTTKSQKEFINSLDDATRKSIKEQSDTYAQHLKSYLRTYTDGELHARVTQTDYDEVMELMREVIYKGRNRNPNRLIDPKAKALSPPHKLDIVEFSTLEILNSGESSNQKNGKTKSGGRSGKRRQTIHLHTSIRKLMRTNIVSTVAQVALSSQISLQSCTFTSNVVFSQISRPDIWQMVQITPHRTHACAHFPVACYISHISSTAHALAQDVGAILCVSLNSSHPRTMSLLGVPEFSDFPFVLSSSATPPTLLTEIRLNPCATPLCGGPSSHLAGPTPNTVKRKSKSRNDSERDCELGNNGLGLRS